MSEQTAAFLQSEQIYLRPLTKGDIPFFYRWENDKSTRMRTGRTRPASRDEVEQRIERKSDDRVWFAIVKKSG